MKKRRWLWQTSRSIQIKAAGTEAATSSWDCRVGPVDMDMDGNRAWLSGLCSTARCCFRCHFIVQKIE